MDRLIPSVFIDLMLEYKSNIYVAFDASDSHGYFELKTAKNIVAELLDNGISPFFMTFCHRVEDHDRITSVKQLDTIIYQSNGGSDLSDVYKNIGDKNEGLLVVVTDGYLPEPIYRVDRTQRTIFIVTEYGSPSTWIFDHFIHQL